jgi:hypothetical protein
MCMQWSPHIQYNFAAAAMQLFVWLPTGSLMNPSVELSAVATRGLCRALPVIPLALENLPLPDQPLVNNLVRRLLGERIR